MGRPHGAERIDAKGKRFDPAAIAARRLGMTPEAYAAHRAAGRLWCYFGRHWRPAERFGADRCRRRTGRAGICIECQAEADRNRAR